MRKSLLSLLLLLLFSSVSLAQSTEFVMQVLVDSAFIRALPDKEAEEVASVFENDSLVAVGRNIDGLWLEVRRPGRQDKVGWISREVAAFTFEVARLPITDLTTGLTGSEAVVDTGYSVLMTGEAKLRTQADRNAGEITVVPVNLTLPVIERTPDRLWLKVNYRGTVGWVSEFLTSTSADVRSIPVSPEYSLNDTGAFEVIPPELQLAQIDRLVAWVAEMDTIAEGVSTYWTLMSNGETMECVPPAGNYPYYPYTPRDVAELPELRRQIRILETAIDDLNSAIETMKRCGVYLDREMRGAYAQAINAQTIFDVVTTQMGNLRERIETYGS